jgi:RNA polymerase II subunit A small phosphatase-like protein
MFETQTRSLLGPNISGKKSCMVLDLDETLIHRSLKPITKYDFVLNVKQNNNTYRVYVRKRPGVDYFLKEMSKYYELVVFTAGMEEYANVVLNKLDPTGLISYRLYRQHCTRQNKFFVKDLNLLGRPLEKTHIIDNNPSAYMMHHSWAIPITSWYEDPHDSELIDMIPFLQNLVKIPKVNDVLDGQTSWRVTNKKLMNHMKQLGLKNNKNRIKFFYIKIKHILKKK